MEINNKIFIRPNPITLNIGLNKYIYNTNIKNNKLRYFLNLFDNNFLFKIYYCHLKIILCKHDKNNFVLISLNELNR